MAITTLLLAMFVLFDVKTAGFQVSLKHVDSGGNFTKFELLQRAMKRGKKRIEGLYAMALAATSDSSIEYSPIHAGNGQFLMELSIGTPPVTYSVILDTGSDLIWTQCKPCKRCFYQQTPIFDPKNSTSFSELKCDSNLCTALPNSSCGDDKKCEYTYEYSDNSYTHGVVATEAFTFGKDNNILVSNVSFGCGNDSGGGGGGGGGGFTQGDGVAGLGRGALSLVSQLYVSNFSYCLTSFGSNRNSTLLINSTQSHDSINKTTALIINPASPSLYYVSLQGISVGNTTLPINKSTFALKPDGTGGMIIDSGTTFTNLEESAFDLVKIELTNQVNLTVNSSNESGLDLCFTLPPDGNGLLAPTLIFHFEGVDVELRGDNYIIMDKGVACVAMVNASSGGISIFGNIQQQNIQVIYDLNKETISFLPIDCDYL